MPCGWRREASKERQTFMPSRVCVCKHSNWQGAMTRLLLWHKEVQAKCPYPFNNLLHYFFSTFSIPSTSCSTKGPSLHSKMTLFGSSGSIVCHTPFGMFTPYRPSSLHSTTSSIIEPSSLCVVTLTFPRRITNVSSFVGCLCIGTSVPGSTAFRNRWHFSSRLRWPRALLAHSEGLEKL